MPLKKASAEIVVVHCVDPRFRRAVESLIAEEFGVGIDDMTVISVPGGVRDIAEYKPGRGLIRFGCEVGTGHHGARKIALVNHEDCGAYGSSSVFPNLDVEIEYHLSQLRSAAEYTQRKIPHVSEIRGYFALMKDTVNLQRLF